jgi:P4 family phage/plasmid primase-like protien
MDPSVEKILRKHYVEKDVCHTTHVSMAGLKGKFQFNRQGQEELWTAYSNAIIANPNATFGIAEKPQHYLPVLGDIDIKIRDVGGEMGDTLYTKEHTRSIIEVYQSVLRNIVEGCTDQSLICVLLEKPLREITKNEVVYLKNGFHLHFPGMFLNKMDQEVHLIPRVKDELNKLKIFENLGFENSGDVIDKACCIVPWLMYGSVKNQGEKPYKVTKVFDAECNEISLEKAFAHYALYDKTETLIPIKGNVKYYLPRILSIVPFSRATNEIRHGLISPIKEKIKAQEGNREFKALSTTAMLEQAKKLVPMLADFRAEDRNEWMTIGWSLHNLGNGCPEALDIWLEFSSRATDIYDEARCVYEWERMVKKDLGIGTLKHYAKLDNPVAYDIFIKERSEDALNESIQGSHNDIAKALYEQYGNEFVAASLGKNGKWFQYVNHIWEEIEDGVFLRNKISDDIVKFFGSMGSKMFGQLAVTTDKIEETTTKKRIELIQKLIHNLKTNGFKRSVMSECADVFYDKRFVGKLDMDPYLIAFQNGIYDLKLNIFRPGRPEDFISKALPINYVEFSEDDDAVLEVHDFFEKVFPDKSVRSYFFDQASDSFVGGNHEKVVNFWTGSGDNAKTITQEIFERMFGKMAIKFNTSVITGKQVQSGGANADLARSGGGVRWAVFEEPNNDEKINNGTFKHMSGGDSYYARDLFEKGKDGREIIPMYKMTFITNTLPEFLHSDQATWNRVRVVPFEAYFVKDGETAPETHEEQMLLKRFPRDKAFRQRIPSLLEPLAWFLLEHRKKIGNNPRVIPPKVLDATANYMKKNDVYRQFCDERIFDGEGMVSPTDLYSEFRNWHKESVPNHIMPTKLAVTDHFTALWGVPRNLKWRGRRIRTLKDDVDDGEAVVMGENELVKYED